MLYLSKSNSINLQYIVAFTIQYGYIGNSVYKLFILRTYRQFQGYAWLVYDKAFREHAAATNLSRRLVRIVNFHTAGSASKVKFIFSGTLLPMYPYCIPNATIYYILMEFDLFRYNIRTLYAYQP